MPPPIARALNREYRQLFAGPVNSLAAVYRDATADMLEVLSRVPVAPYTRMRGIYATPFARARARALLKQYQETLAVLQDHSVSWGEQHMPQAYRLGAGIADKEVDRARRAGINLQRQPREIFLQVHREAVQASADAMINGLAGAGGQIGRRVEDVFREVSLLSVTQGIARGATRREVTRDIQQRLLDAGRPYFTDRGGRMWTLDRYAEMVARTTTREAVSQGTHNRLREHGIRLEQVSSHNANDFCLYYEGMVVCVEGSHPDYPDISAINGGTPFHPNCAHVMVPFVDKLATRKELEAGKPKDESVLNKSPAELQERFKHEFPERYRAEQNRLRLQAARRRRRRRFMTPRPAEVPAPETREFAPGTLLKRTYKGRTHVVTTLETGVEYQGRVYSSLTAVAKDITGQRAINGPLWFRATGTKPRGAVARVARPAAEPAPIPRRKAKPKPTSPEEMTARVEDELKDAMKTKCTWNGKLRDSPHGSDYLGAKEWDCSIAIDPKTKRGLKRLLKTDAKAWAEAPERVKKDMFDSFQTVVHEMTHAAGVEGTVKASEYSTVAARWVEETVTSAASEHVTPRLFERIMGFKPSGITPRAAYKYKQQSLAQVLGGPGAGRKVNNPMEGINPRLYLELAYHTPRRARLEKLGKQAAQTWARLGWTHVEWEAAMKDAAGQAVFDARRALQAMRTT